MMRINISLFSDVLAFVGSFIHRRHLIWIRIYVSSQNQYIHIFYICIYILCPYIYTCVYLYLYLL